MRVPTWEEAEAAVFSSSCSSCGENGSDLGTPASTHNSSSEHWDTTCNYKEPPNAATTKNVTKCMQVPTWEQAAKMVFSSSDESGETDEAILRPPKSEQI